MCGIIAGVMEELIKREDEKIATGNAKNFMIAFARKI
jgi:hypothetical protein